MLFLTLSMLLKLFIIFIKTYFLVEHLPSNVLEAQGPFPQYPNKILAYDSMRWLEDTIQLGPCGARDYLDHLTNACVYLRLYTEIFRGLCCVRNQTRLTTIQDMCLNHITYTYIFSIFKTNFKCLTLCFIHSLLIFMPISI